MAKKLAQDCAEHGYTIVSGMARGIDYAAHNGALQGKTMAVLAGGADNIYPKTHHDLYQEIIQSGLVLSEQPLGRSPQARHFPQRNRIIAGLAQAVIVVEGALKSGSLITASDAADFGRDVMAIPGHPFDARAAGCNALIRDGAILVRNSADIIDQLTPSTAPTQPPQSPKPCTTEHPTDAQDKLRAALTSSPLHVDTLIRDTGLSATCVASALTTLELAGEIERQSGGQIARSR